MRSAGRFSLAQLLCALCGMWAVLAPVSPQIHQSLAKHRHVYCTEHYRIEDEAVLETHDRFMAGLGRETATTVSGVAPSASSVVSGIECLFSNFLAHAVTRVSGRTITGVVSAELPQSRVCEIDLRSVDTYRIAPKTSPPASA
jgi:hypothetical protein